MFNFKKNKFLPFVAKLNGDIDAAFGVESIPDRIDQLYAAKKEHKDFFSNLGERAANQFLWGGLISIVGTIFAASGLGGTASIALTASAALGPVGAVIAGAVLLAGGLLMACKGVTDVDISRPTAKAIERRIDGEITRLMTAHPVEASRSKCFARLLRTSFSPAAAAPEASPAANPGGFAPVRGKVLQFPQRS